MRVPDALAYDLGRGTLSTLDGTLFHPSKLPTERRAELQRRFDELAAHHSSLPLRLELRAGLANAFALPDGTVVVTDELVELAKNDDEIVGVLAHEVGHVQGRHAMRMALESSAVGLFALAYFGDASQLSAILGALPAMFANAHYSQSHEIEADEFALTYLDAARISPSHLAAILERLGKQHGDDDSGPNYLSSHPPTAERVARLTGPRR
jgi:Zn-dependent protease with chaperone function